jgi:hypothetical protein
LIDPVVAFESTFEIVSSDTVITGSTTLIAGFGDCEPALSAGERDGFEFVSILVEYEAVIHTPTGDFADRGTADVNAQDRQIVAPFPDRSQEFHESASRRRERRAVAMELAGREPATSRVRASRCTS